MKWQLDWSKIVHLYSDVFFVAGGMFDQKHISVIMNATYIVNAKSGLVIKKKTMSKGRQCHGMVKINGYVYACGGYN